MITFHEQLLPIEGPPVAINCPICGAKEVMSAPIESVDRVKIAYLIPILKLRGTSIRCGQCGKQISCVAPMEKLAGLDAAAIDSFLRYKPTPAAKRWSWIALITSIIPLLGLVFAGIATYHGRGTEGWTGDVNLLSIIVSVTSTVLTILMVVMPM